MGGTRGERRRARLLVGEHLLHDGQQRHGWRDPPGAELGCGDGVGEAQRAADLGAARAAGERQCPAQAVDRGSVGSDHTHELQGVVTLQRADRLADLAGEGQARRGPSHADRHDVEPTPPVSQR
ncbi:MAG: hypothetical protein FD127_2772 [Acidimicrobiaceae bacterium]|nr:MAG: hypothetical protein FD127_2772 [Acidimicrobiaceae bacterium]